VHVNSSAVSLTIRLMPIDTGADFTIETSGSGEQMVHATGSLTLADSYSGPVDVISIDELLARCPETLSADDLYRGFLRHGVDYGEGFRAVVSVRHNRMEAISSISLPASVQALASKCILHPTLLDAALQTVAALASSRTFGVPFSLDSMQIRGTVAEARYTYAKLASAPSGGVSRYDLFLLDETGGVLASFKNLTTRPIVHTLEHNPPTTRILDVLEALQAGRISVEEADRILL
jgi:hypothetical protein